MSSFGNDGILSEKMDLPLSSSMAYPPVIDEIIVRLGELSGKRQNAGFRRNELQKSSPRRGERIHKKIYGFEDIGLAGSVSAGQDIALTPRERSGRMILEGIERNGSEHSVILDTGVI